MQQTILPRAKVARDILELQFRAGKATLMDFLDAERTCITTQLEADEDLGAYWNAVFTLEAALALELRT